MARLYESDFDLDIKKISQEIENEGVTLVRIGEETNLKQVVVHNLIHAKWQEERKIVAKAYIAVIIIQADSSQIYSST